MNQIKAEIKADSINTRGDRITSMLLTLPRFILAELSKHRMFSMSSASSRAIPFKKMVEMVKDDPFVPIAFQADHKGMQGTEYLTGDDAKFARNRWLQIAAETTHNAHFIHNVNVTKQLCNRILEPFMWHQVLVTATEWDNFFELRCPVYEHSYLKNCVFKSKRDLRNALSKYASDHEDMGTEIEATEVEQGNSDLVKNHSQAEIHIQALAEAMWDAMNESEPQKLKEGEWHIPFNLSDREVFDLVKAKTHHYTEAFSLYTGVKGGIAIEDAIRDELGVDNSEKLKIKIATARAARLSYANHEGEIDYEKDIKLHDRLLKDKHMTPFEHCARAMTKDEYDSYIKGIADEIEEHLDFFDVYFLNPPVHDRGWAANFKGFISYRKTVEE